MSPRRRSNITTARALRAGATLHDLLDEARIAAQYGSPDDNRPDVMAAVVQVIVQRLLDDDTPEAVLIAAAETWQQAGEQAAAVRDEKQARREKRRRRLWDIVRDHPCPACQAPAGEPCTTLSPARRPKPVAAANGLHAARLRLAAEPSQTDQGASA